MQKLVSYSDFSKLRLDQFCAGTIERTGAAIWEWMGGEWYCDGIGFTWFGCLDGMPNETGCMEIHLSELPQSEAEAILAAIGISLTAGMSFESVSEIFGEPFDVESFVDDRKTYVFQAGADDTYKVDCTVQDTDGLVFVSVVRNDVLQRIDAQQSLT